MKHFGRSLLNPTLATLLSAFAAGTAVAEPATNAAPPSFKDYDSNADGMVSQEEFRALGGHEQTFLKADANRDNKLSIEEFAKASAYEGRA